MDSNNNQLQDTRPKQTYPPNPNFSPNLQQDLYNQQYQQQSHKQQYAQQQIQTIQGPTPNPSSYQLNGNDIYYNEQYSPQSQQYVDSSNFVFSQPVQQSISVGPSFSPAVTGNYQYIQRPQYEAIKQPVKNQNYILYPPTDKYFNYAPANVRPIYQPQQNYNNVRPSNEGSGGGIMESISNFFTNIGQGAADLFSSRPAINSYRPPVSDFTPNQAAESVNYPNQAYAPSNFLSGNGNPVGQFSKAIDEITRNDDYQCIPKVICQMVGSQRRQPSILSSPIFSS